MPGPSSSTCTATSASPTSTVTTTSPAAWRAALATRWSRPAPQRRLVAVDGRPGGVGGRDDLDRDAPRGGRRRRGRRRRPPPGRGRTARSSPRASSSRSSTRPCSRSSSPSSDRLVVVPVGVGDPPGDLQLGAHHGDRRAQLVGGVGHESAAGRLAVSSRSSMRFIVVASSATSSELTPAPAPARAASASRSRRPAR